MPKYPSQPPLSPLTVSEKSGSDGEEEDPRRSAVSPMKDLVKSVRAKMTNPLKFQMTVTDPEGERLTPPDDKSERGKEGVGDGVGVKERVEFACYPLRYAAKGWERGKQ
eukprot:sb/3477449/